VGCDRVSADCGAIRAAQRTGRIYALATNLMRRLSPTRVLRTYKEQSLVKCSHENGKQTLRVRPILLQGRAARPSGRNALAAFRGPRWWG